MFDVDGGVLDWKTVGQVGASGVLAMAGGPNPFRAM